MSSSRTTSTIAIHQTPSTRTTYNLPCGSEPRGGNFTHPPPQPARSHRNHKYPIAKALLIGPLNYNHKQTCRTIAPTQVAGDCAPAAHCNQQKKSIDVSIKNYTYTNFHQIYIKVSILGQPTRGLPGVRIFRSGACSVRGRRPLALDKNKLRARGPPPPPRRIHTF